jgi:hypothetical protein
MSNRATGMAFLALFTALLISLHLQQKGYVTGLFLIFFAFVFLVAGVIFLMLGDERAGG